MKELLDILGWVVILLFVVVLYRSCSGNKDIITKKELSIIKDKLNSLEDVNNDFSADNWFAKEDSLKLLYVIQQFNKRNGYRQATYPLLEPCVMVDSVFSLFEKINKIGQESNYTVILENEVEFIKLYETSLQILPLYGTIINNIDHFKAVQDCKNEDEYEAKIEKILEDKQVREWFRLQFVVVGLYILDKGDLHIPIY